MNGKQILLNAIRGQPTPRPAWLPFVGCHGGKLIGESARDYLTDAGLLEAGLRRAHELYRPDGLPIVFDLQIEAEILGCQLNWADEVPPAVCSHPLAEGVKLEQLPRMDSAKGRFPMIIEAMGNLKKEIGAETALFGLLCGPFTMALHLLGNEIFLEMHDDEERVKEILDFCSGIAIQTANIYLENGADVVAVVDPMTSQIAPSHFKSFVAGPMNKVFDSIRAGGGLSSIFVCGDVTRNLDVICDTRADNICVDEQIDMAALRDLALPRGKSFGGNIKLTSVLLLGDEDDARREAIEILDKCGSTGFILAPGCDLPYAVPERNIKAIAEIVHDEYSREATRVALSVKAQDTFDDVILPDYAAEEKLIIDVITLDSQSCAPCQYMMAAAIEAASCADFPCEVREHKIKERKGIGMMSKLGVSNLPTICLAGVPTFNSIIPDQKSLVAAIHERGANRR